MTGLITCFFYLSTGLQEDFLQIKFNLQTKKYCYIHH